MSQSEFMGVPKISTGDLARGLDVARFIIGQDAKHGDVYVNVKPVTEYGHTNVLEDGAEGYAHRDYTDALRWQTTADISKELKALYGDGTDATVVITQKDNSYLLTPHINPRKLYYANIFADLEPGQ